jgi:hypothetical protein
MAEAASTNGDAAVAVVEPPQPGSALVETEPRASKREMKRKKSKGEEELEYEVEFETPFGKIEFELEPTLSKERKDRQRREQAEREAAKAAAKAAKHAEKQRKKRDAVPAIERGGGSKLLPILVVFLLVAAAVALAIWLFARPGEEENDIVPPEFRSDDVAAEPGPQGFAAKARQRIRHAVRAGRQASREVQAEQERKFQDLTGKK